MPSTMGPYDQIILFGDSLTEQSANPELDFIFMAALQNLYIRRLDIINRGFSGYNTAQAVKVLPAFMPSPDQAHVKILTIFFGANDACVPSSSTGQHIPLEEYVQNLKTLVDHSSVKAHSPHILLITPPPVDEYTLEGMDYMNNNGDTEVKRRAAVTKTYADACRKLGEELGIEVVDIWNTIVTKAGWTPGQPLPGSKDMPRSPVLGELFRDGLHFSSQGYKVLFDEITNRIEKCWPELSPLALPSRFPYWTEAPR